VTQKSDCALIRVKETMFITTKSSHRIIWKRFSRHNKQYSLYLSKRVSSLKTLSQVKWEFPDCGHSIKTTGIRLLSNTTCMGTLCLISPLIVYMLMANVTCVRPKLLGTCIVTESTKYADCGRLPEALSVGARLYLIDGIKRALLLQV